ncbi:hypothetical protein [Pasteurella sp. PK-2025]|uniref:hypothetical protein n=1 Tax=Pasteurella sp. PK-2025 TaxID=3413133 RepID=UPI003C74C9A7
MAIKNNARFYKIEPHSKGLGVVAIEYSEKNKKETGWRRNFSTQCLCETAIKKRKIEREQFDRTIVKKSNFSFTESPAYKYDNPIKLRNLGLVDFSK